MWEKNARKKCKIQENDLKIMWFEPVWPEGVFSFLASLILKNSLRFLSFKENLKINPEQTQTLKEHVTTFYKIKVNSDPVFWAGAFKVKVKVLKKVFQTNRNKIQERIPATLLCHKQHHKFYIFHKERFKRLQQSHSEITKGKISNQDDKNAGKS